ncbi:hypothetical protein Tco_0909359 [Tanacetum coccineum]|uniref:Uncharacterized protein n=1 Tax=Tanacetum coccineum TaxID=301880 RepID=A0ABQ5CW26_9ASTR
MKEVVAQAHNIDWSNPVVLRYNTLQNRPFSVAEAMKNMCIYLKNQDSDIERTEEVERNHLLGKSRVENLSEEVLRKRSCEAWIMRKKNFKLVKERFQTASLEDYDLLLWGDLKIMIEPNEEDEIWRHQQRLESNKLEVTNFCGYVLFNGYWFVISHDGRRRNILC